MSIDLFFLISTCSTDLYVTIELENSLKLISTKFNL